MKLWIKLTLLFTLLINLIIELGLFYINPKVEDFSIDLVGEKLKSISATIAASIDGDTFTTLNLFDSTSIKSEPYKRITKTIKQTKEILNLSDEQYNILVLDKNSIAFGIILSSGVSSDKVLLKISEPAKKTVTKVYKNKHCEYTTRYYDKNGSRISGLAPIYDSQKNVVGIIQVDQKFEDVANRIASINNTINIGRLYLIPITILISFLFSMFFLTPITKVKEKIVKIAEGNYQESEEIKSGGEIKELVNAAELLRTTILKQQSKIFNSISELEEAKSKAEASDKMKGEFLAVISHEIRTPLNIILGNIQILNFELDDSKVEELKEITDSIKFGSDRLIRTVEMTVLYSDIVCGSFNKNEEKIDVNKLFYNTIKPYTKEAETKKIKVITDCSLSSQFIKGDKFLIDETIKQIADNAIKYSSCCEIKFCINQRENGAISLAITDNGIGISDAFMENIFKPFLQEDMRLERSYEGNGLGLALAKKCCDENGFELTIVSKKDEGTTVEIIIPTNKIVKEII